MWFLCAARLQMARNSRPHRNRRSKLTGTKLKMQYMEQEYWRLRNGKQNYIRCPYCVKGRHGRRRNFVDGAMCCVLFAKAFGAILERQNAVDEGMRHAQNIMRLSQMVQGQPN